MRLRATLLILLLMPIGLCCSPASADLGVGDRAPELSVKEWVKGAPVDLAKDTQKRIHVVEFWAVWCPPCKMSVPLLTRLQKKFNDEVVIIGITEPDAGRNTPSAIRQFVKEQGSDMDYTVAIDSGKTTEAYMVAAGAIGIPHAFIVGKDGRIAWQGSPLEPGLEDILDQLVAGKFDAEAAKRVADKAKIQQQIDERITQLSMLAELGQWQGVWDGLADILKLDPSNEFAIGTLRDISVQELKDETAFRQWAVGHIDLHAHDAEVMQSLAGALWATADLRSRFPDLAVQAAKAAYKAGRQRDASSIAVYAQALYHIGSIDRAISLQQDAAAVASEGEKEQIRSTLDYYRSCKKLQEAGP